MSQPEQRPVPAIIGAIFGSLWALIAAFALPLSWRLPAAALAVGIGLLLIVRLARARVAVAGRSPLFIRRTYRIAVIAEVILIGAASAALPRLDLQPYFIQAVGLIVGLHFIGLWLATGAPRFLYVTALMVMVSLASALLPAGVGAIHVRDLATGIGNALVLWIAASWPRQGAGGAARPMVRAG